MGKTTNNHLKGGNNQTEHKAIIGLPARQAPTDEDLSTGLKAAQERVKRLEQNGADAVIISGAKFIVETYQDEIRNRK